MKTKGLMAAGMLFFAPGMVSAAVTISEIVWMGTPEESNGEWIELHNDGAEAVDMSGWELYEAGGSTPLFSLTQSIEPGGYLVIERTTPSVPDPLPDIADEAGSFGGSGLNNSGEHLVLKDDAGVIADELDFSSDGWPAGNASTKETMQWNGVEWITADGTPKAANALVGSEDDSEPTVASSTPSGTPSSHSSSASASTKRVIKISLSKERDRLAAVGAPLRFEAVARDSKGEEVRGTRYEWSFGDGSHERSAKVEHAYEFPGTYVVVANAENGKAEAVSRFLVTVVPVKLWISEDTDMYVELENSSVYEINIQDWQVRGETGHFEFPRDTIVPANSKVKFSRKLLKIRGQARLVAPKGMEESMETTVEEKKEENASSSPDVSVSIDAETLPGIPTPQPLQQPAISPAAPASKPSDISDVDEVMEPAIPIQESSPNQSQSSTSSKDSSLTASVVQIYKGESAPSLVGQIAAWLSSWLR